MIRAIECICCGEQPDPAQAWRTCPRCGGGLQFRYDFAEVWEQSVSGQRGIWRWKSLLPVAGDQVSCGEGGTPLIGSRLDAGCHLYLKDETRNPTGSQKDRALAVALRAAQVLGQKRCLMASTGSAGISCAAYAARAGVQATILVPKGVPVQRLVAMWMLGARIFEVDGSFEDLMTLMAAAREGGGYFETTTYRKANPYQAEGPKTIAYELFEELGRAPDAVVVPIGGGGTLSGIARGFADLKVLGRIDRVPRMYGVQHERFDALARAQARGVRDEESIRRIGEELDARVEVVTGNMKHNFPPDGEEALAAITATGGAMVTVSDADALAAQLDLSRTEGMFAEPTSAASLAAVQKLTAAGLVGPDETAVALITGSGLRETELAVRTQNPQIIRTGLKDGLRLLLER